MQVIENTAKLIFNNARIPLKFYHILLFLGGENYFFLLISMVFLVSQ